MDLKKLWTKLFSRNDEADEIELHVSGATVRHRNPFENLEVPRNEEKITQDKLDKWVAPFYMSRFSLPDNSTIKSFADASNKINLNVVTELLSDFDWRTRISGAYFAAINNYKELEDIIGRHLLKSEVCYAGSGYSLALAIFATDNSKKYLQTYLEYYLDRKDLYFDQAEVFCALEYLDKTSADKLYDKYLEFVYDKPYWDLDQSRKYFSECIMTIKQIQTVALT